MRTYWLQVARGLSALVVLLLLAACGGGGGDGGGDGDAARGADSKGGVASGTVLLGGVASSAVPGGGVSSAVAPGSGVVSAAPGGGTASAAVSPPPLPPHVPNEVIVKFRDRVPELNKTLALSRMSGTRLRAFRFLDGLEHHRLPRHVSVDEAIAKYRKDPDVLYAEPNYIVRTTNTPNDTRFGELWGL